MSQEQTPFMNIDAVREQMIEQQVRAGDVLDERILEALAANSEDVALLVGTGTGYLAACLGKLAARVRGMEIIPELAEQSRVNLMTVAVNNVSVEVADGMQ